MNFEHKKIINLLIDNKKEKYNKRVRKNKSAIEKYNERVRENISAIEKGNADRYKDPDKNIVASVKLGDEEFKVAFDGICGIKYLQKYYKPDICACRNEQLDGNTDINKELAKAYKIIRSKVIVWPRHAESINQRRYLVFRDRIDFTLCDIGEFYKSGCKESKLIKKDSDTYKYLKKIGTFRNFIELYDLDSFTIKNDKDDNRVDVVTSANLDRLVIENDNDIKIKNLGSNEDIEISNYNEYLFNEETNAQYINNLIRILNTNNS